MKYMRTFLIFAALLTVTDFLAYKTVVYWFPAQDGNSISPDGLTWFIALLGLSAALAGGLLQYPAIFLVTNVLQVRLSSLPLNGYPLIIFLSAGMYMGLHILIDIQRKKGLLNKSLNANDHPSDTVQRDSAAPE